MEGGYKSLVVWQKAMIMAREVYKVTEQLPTKEQFGLISQLRRSAVSVPSNIAEGSRRGTKNDYAQFLRIAHGSVAELETQLLLTKDLYPKTEVDSLLGILDEIGRMLYALIKKLKQ